MSRPLIWTEVSLWPLTNSFAPCFAAFARRSAAVTQGLNECQFMFKTPLSRSSQRARQILRSPIVDAGPLIGWLNANDQWHEWSVSTLSARRGPLHTTEIVLGEACWHLGVQSAPKALFTSSETKRSNSSFFISVSANERVHKSDQRSPKLREPNRPEEYFSNERVAGARRKQLENLS